MNFLSSRRTKIVATLGPACSDKDTLLAMIKAGLDVARLNFSHADHKTHENSLNLIRGINKEYNTNIAILQDLQGPKIRIGELKKVLKIKPGDVITFRSDISKQAKDSEEIPIIYDTFAHDVKEGETILIDDGKVELLIAATNKRNIVQAEVKHGEEIKSRKGVNFPMTQISVPTITEKDFQDIEFAIKHQVEWLALSFVRSADDIRVLKELIRLKNGTSKIIAKIEKPEALENIDEIIDATDGIMVARGDLGVEIPMEEVPAWQKRIVRKCNEKAKPVIVATQMMESMITNPRPTRAEASDVANAVVDGTDAVMLSGETSVGNFPVRVVESMTRILQSVEKVEDSIYYKYMDEITQDTGDELSVAITKTACKLAKEAGAKAIVALTNSGYTATHLSQCRPKSMIYAFTNSKSICSTLNLLWGIRALFYEGFENTEETIQAAHEILRDKGLIDVDDVLINTGSMPLANRGLTNMIKISRATSKIV